MPIENGLVAPVIDDQNVSRKRTAARTRKYHEKPKARGCKGKYLSLDPLAQSFHMEDARFRFAFPNTIANRHEPNARRQYSSGHNKPQTPQNPNVISS